MPQQIDARQSKLRDSVSQLGTGTNLALDKLLNAADSDLTSPLRIVPHTTQSPPRVNIQSLYVTNSETGRKRTIPAINNVLPTFASWINRVATTTNGSAVVSVLQTGHGLSTGDIVTITTSVAIGGIQASYLSEVATSVTVTDVNNFTYVAGSNATSSTTGTLDYVAYGGSVSLPASNGGTITVSPASQAAQTLTITSGSFIKIGMFLDAVGNISITFGTEGASIALATVPPSISNTFPIGYFVAQNVAGTIQPITNSHIYQFGSGGGGSGSGDASGTLETFKNTLVDSPYELLTPYISSQDAATLFSAFGGTASYSIVDAAIKFAAGADSATSIQLLDASEFLNTNTDLSQVDVAVEWKSTNIDTAATYEVSRDGGVHYKPVTLTRVGNGTNMFNGSYQWTREEEDTSTFSVGTLGGGAVLSKAGFPTTEQWVAQPYIIANSTTISSISVGLTRISSPVGSFRIVLYGDSGGNPGSVLAAGSFTLASTLAISTFALISASVNVTVPAGTYYVGVETDATYLASAGSDRIVAATDGAGPSRRYNGSIWSNFGGNDVVSSITGTGESFVDQTALGAGYAVANATIQTDNLDDGTNRTFLSQAFTTTAAMTMKKATLYLNKIQSSGTVAGNLFAAIYSDNAGSPSTTVLGESIAVLSSSIATGQQAVEFDIPNIALAAGTYHIVLRGDATYRASYSVGVREFAWRADNTSPPVVGKRSTNGTSWTALTGNFTFFIAGRPLDLRLRITASAANKLLTAFAVFYNLSSGTVAGGIKKRQVFTFNGNTQNLNSFLVTGFQVDPEMIRVYWVEGGQVFVFPSFATQGQTLQFPVNTFYSPVSNTVTLVADQNDGSSFDGSNANLSLLAENHLGSQDANLDKSLPGRGILLRRNDGVLVELSVNSSNNIVISSVP